MIIPISKLENGVVAARQQGSCLTITGVLSLRKHFLKYRLTCGFLVRFWLEYGKLSLCQHELRGCFAQGAECIFFEVFASPGRRGAEGVGGLAQLALAPLRRLHRSLLRALRNPYALMRVIASLN